MYYIMLYIILYLTGVLVELAGRCGTFVSHSTYGSGSYGPNINNEWIIRSDQVSVITKNNILLYIIHIILYTHRNY